MATYSTEIQLFDYPHTVNTSGKEKMTKTYSSLFQRIPDLKCVISNRIALGNYVIDFEEFSGQGNKWQGVAIYEVQKAQIKRATFL